MHSESPLPTAEILATMPTDDDIAELYRRTAYEPQKREGLSNGETVWCGRSCITRRLGASTGINHPSTRFGL